MKTYTAAAISFLLFSGFGAVAGNRSVTIDSLDGKAEVQRAGRQRWELAAKRMRLDNNDMIRVLDGSLAKLAWSDGSSMYVHQNSQVLINLHDDTAANFFTKHATVFFGAAFFVIKKTLPRGVANRFDTKVYTPTAALSIRGTSFEVAVDAQNGATDIRVLNGTVLVGNILKQESIFLSAGFETTVTLNEDPALPRALLASHIDSLKAWLPTALIESEMKNQIARARKDHYTITGKLEDKLLVMPLGNASSYNGRWDLQRRFSEFLAATIAKSANIAVSAASYDSLDVVAAGEKEKARFVLSGEIETFDIFQRAEINAAADRYREYFVARVDLRLQLVDISQRKQIYEGEVSGEVSGTNKKDNSWQTIGAMPLRMTDSTFSQTILAQAIRQSLEEASGQLKRYCK